MELQKMKSKLPKIKLLTRTTTPKGSFVLPMPKRIRKPNINTIKSKF